MPDPRNAARQHHCSQPACRRARKAASQRRWLGKKPNRDYFRDEENVARVQAWRRRHPGYWRRAKSAQNDTQPTEPQPVAPVRDLVTQAVPAPGTLQDFWPLQDPALVGLISMVTGYTLQEDIAATTRQLLLRGRNILGHNIPGASVNKTVANL